MTIQPSYPLRLFAGLVVAGAVVPGEAAAQDAGGLAIEYAAPVTLGDIAEGSPNLKLSLVTARANLGYPIPIKSTGTIIIPGVNYRGTFPIIENGPRDSIASFHEIALQLTVVQPLSDSLTLALRVAPALATNFIEVDGDAVRFGALGLLLWQISDNFRLGFGILANYNFGQLLPLPGLEVDWRPTDNLHVNAFLPARARIAWSVVDFIEIGAATRLSGNRYTIRDRDNPTVESLIYTVVDAYAFFDVQIHDWVWLSFQGGHTLFRNFDVRDDQNNQVGGRSFNNTPIIGFNVAIRPPRKLLTGSPRGLR